MPRLIKFTDTDLQADLTKPIPALTEKVVFYLLGMIQWCKYQHLSVDSWQAVVRKLLKQRGDRDDLFPLTMSFMDLQPEQRLEVLYLVCSYVCQEDSIQLQEYAEQEDSDAIRMQPLGYDVSENYFFYFGDYRLYIAGADDTYRTCEGLTQWQQVLDDLSSTISKVDKQQDSNKKKKLVIYCPERDLLKVLEPIFESIRTKLDLLHKQTQKEHYFMMMPKRASGRLAVKLNEEDEQRFQRIQAEKQAVKDKEQLHIQAESERLQVGLLQAQAKQETRRRREMNKSRKKEIIDAQLDLAAQMKDVKRELISKLVLDIETRTQSRRRRVDSKRSLAKELRQTSGDQPAIDFLEQQMSILDQEGYDSEDEQILQWTTQEMARTLSLLGNEMVMNFEVPDRLKSLLAVGEVLRQSLKGADQLTDLGEQQFSTKITRAKTKINTDTWADFVHLATVQWMVDLSQFKISDNIILKNECHEALSTLMALPEAQPFVDAQITVESVRNDMTTESMDLTRIMHSLLTDQYETVQDLMADLETMVQEMQGVMASGCAKLEKQWIKLMIERVEPCLGAVVVDEATLLLPVKSLPTTQSQQVSANDIDPMQIDDQ